MSHNIENDTGIMVDMIAEKVIEEAANLLKSSPETVQYLTGYLAARE